MADTQAEIARISKELKKLNDAFEKEKKGRQDDRQKQQKQLEDIINIILEYDQASTKVIRYVIRLDARYNNLILALQDAVISFNEFIRLPPSSNNLSKYWDAAWQALATIMPMLRISPAWIRLEQTAQTELKAVNNLLQNANTRTTLVTLAQRGHNVADWISKENTLAARMRDVEIRKPKADMSRSPIKAMMEESNAAHKALETTVDRVYEEYKARLLAAVVGNLSAPTAGTQKPTETLEKMVERLLPPLNYVEQDEAEQVKRRFLFEICKAWAPQNVAVVTTVFRIGESTTIEGLNDSQQDQVMSWFGPSSNWIGGSVPVFPSIWNYVGFWQVPQRRASSGGSVFGFG